MSREGSLSGKKPVALARFFFSNHALSYNRPSTRLSLPQMLSTFEREP
jgi:hypothetical protein